MPTDFHDLILLTGAGFTKNFGGFVATEMWAQIYNHPCVQESDYLRGLLQNDFDFESIYSKVIEDQSVTDEDKNRINEAVQSAYRTLDEATKDWVFNTDSPYPVCWYTLNRLLKLFNGSGGKQGLFFTLNQDIFMERRSGSVCPGVSPFRGTHGRLESSQLQLTDFVTVPRDDAEDKMNQAMAGHCGIAYIKLHGSYGWRTSGGSSSLVIGKNKGSLIMNEPLLREYFKLFQSALASGGKRILVIGYGFRDAHINEVLAQAVRDAGLKIYVLGTSSPEKWKTGVMQDEASGADILRGLAGYYPYSLLEMFPANQSETAHFLSLKAALSRK